MNKSGIAGGIHLEKSAALGPEKSARKGMTRKTAERKDIQKKCKKGGSINLLSGKEEIQGLHEQRTKRILQGLKARRAKNARQSY